MFTLCGFLTIEDMWSRIIDSSNLQHVQVRDVRSSDMISVSRPKFEGLKSRSCWSGGLGLVHIVSVLFISPMHYIDVPVRLCIDATGLRE